MPNNNVVSSFNTGLQIAVEDTLGVAPSLSTNPFHFNGGRWFQLDANALPNIQDMPHPIFPTSYAGRRARNTRSPIQGREHSEGTATGFFDSNTGALMLYGALGSLTTERVDSTDFELLTAEPLTAAQKSLVLATQPSDGGAILRFHIQGASDGGTITIAGINSLGNPASETLSFSSATCVYSRQSWSSIGASGITITSQDDATVDIHGISYFKHTISFNNTSNPTFSILRFGDPTAGAASIQRLHPGMVFNDFGMQSPAQADDGLVTANVGWIGFPTATCTLGSLISPSAGEIWPAWVQSVTRDGSAYNKMTNFSMAVDPGAGLQKAAAGVKSPQGHITRGMEVTGSFSIYVTDEDEYNRWKNASANNIVLTWDNPPYPLTSAINVGMIASMNQMYFENVTLAEEDDTLMLNADYRLVEDASTGLFKVTYFNRVPGIAYGNTVA